MTAFQNKIKYTQFNAQEVNSMFLYSHFYKHNVVIHLVKLMLILMGTNDAPLFSIYFDWIWFHVKMYVISNGSWNNKERENGNHVIFKIISYTVAFHTICCRPKIRRQSSVSFSHLIYNNLAHSIDISTHTSTNIVGMLKLKCMSNTMQTWLEIQAQGSHRSHAINDFLYISMASNGRSKAP